MVENGKDLTKVGLIAACVVIAGVMTWRSVSGGGPTGIESVDAGEMVLTRCANPDCQFQSEMEKRVYFEAVLALQRQKPQFSHPPLVCPECDKNRVFRVVLCPKCAHVFKHGGLQHNAADRCPECRYSQSEEDRKQGV